MRKLILLLSIVLLFFSCENNADVDNSIAGKWNVTQIIGGFSQPKNYEKGSFTWTFNFDNNTVTIVNTADVFNTKPISTFINNMGGVFSFKIKTENNIDYLIVDDRKGTIKLSGNNLTIDYGIAFDDVAYIFTR